MLTQQQIDTILSILPSRSVAVLGDLFLDRYLELDGQLTEPSLETGRDAYQVVHVRSCPGAAGTVINNLAALGVGRIIPISFMGDDGEGYELRQALHQMPALDLSQTHLRMDRRTPTYTKPMLHRPGFPPEELNRLDIKNRQPLPHDLEEQLIRSLKETISLVDAMIVLDQVSEANCGVVTDRIRQTLEELAQDHPERFILADSRERIKHFRHVTIKPNLRECFGTEDPEQVRDWEPGFVLSRTSGRSVFCTCGEQGIRIFHGNTKQQATIPSYPVSGPIDIVGAGDSCSAGITCAKMAGCSEEQAAAFGNLVASITIQQIGTTGSASPDQVRSRWGEINS